MSSDAKREGYVGPNDPAYYAPRELRERSTSEQPGTMPIQTEEWRPRMPTEGPPLQPFGKPPRRQDSEMFTKAVAQAMQEARDVAPVEAPSVLRDLSGRRALFQQVIRFSIAVAIAASIATLLVMAIPSSQRPASQDNASLSAAWQSVKSSVTPAPQPAPPAKRHGDPGRAGRQRVHQRSGAARHSRRRSAARRVRIHQRTDGRRSADVRQACRWQRVAGAGDGDFRRFGHSAGRIHRPDAGHGGIA